MLKAQHKHNTTSNLTYLTCTYVRVMYIFCMTLFLLSTFKRKQKDIFGISQIITRQVFKYRIEVGIRNTQKK